MSRNAPQSRYGVGTIDNGIDRPALARPTLSLLKRRNGTAQFVPIPFSLFHANLSFSSTLDTVECHRQGFKMLDFGHLCIDLTSDVRAFVEECGVLGGDW